jgi:putative transposase
MRSPADPHYRHRFRAEVISHAVWLYHVFSLSLRDVELLLAERGIVASYETVRRWCKKFDQPFSNRLRRRRPRPGEAGPKGAHHNSPHRNRRQRDILLFSWSR